MYLQAFILIPNYEQHETIQSIFFFFSSVQLMGKTNFLTLIKPYNRKENLQLNISFSDSLGNQSDLPLVVMKGKQRWPTFFYFYIEESTALNSLLSLQCKNLYKKSMPNHLRGTLIILPISSPGSFYNQNSLQNSQDNVNLNNAFPGNANGTITQKMAHYITQNIIPLSDVFLDPTAGCS